MNSFTLTPKAERMLKENKVSINEFKKEDELILHLDTYRTDRSKHGEVDRPIAFWTEEALKKWQEELPSKQEAERKNPSYFYSKITGNWQLDKLFYDKLVVISKEKVKEFCSDPQVSIEQTQFMILIKQDKHEDFLKAVKPFVMDHETYKLIMPFGSCYKVLEPVLQPGGIRVSSSSMMVVKNFETIEKVWIDPHAPTAPYLNPNTSYSPRKFSPVKQIQNTEAPAKENKAPEDNQKPTRTCVTM